jgi:ATP-dependent Clp protease protease subunit
MIPENNLQDAEIIQVGLLNHHKHFLTGEINYENVSRAIQWIIYEHTLVDRAKYLSLYLNSGGGDLYNAFGLVDVMRASSIPVRTIGMGSIMSAAALIFACGAKGHRMLGKNTGIMLHQFSSNMEGKEHELQAAMRELEFCRGRVIDLLTAHCGISEKVVRDKLLSPTDAWLTAEEAMKCKLADGIFSQLT